MTARNAAIRKVLDKTGLPLRVVHSAFGCCAIAIATMMRICLDLVVNNGKELKHKRKHFIKLKLFSKNKRSLFNINATHRLMWMSYYAGYVLSNVPGGMLADKYGSKWILARTIMISACLTFLTPMAFRYNSTVVLIVLRFLLGLCGGPTYPALSALLAEWVPKKERGTLGVLTFSGSKIGTFIINFLWHVFFRYNHQMWIFYLISIGALIWSIGFMLICSSNPESNVYVDISEKTYICNDIGHCKTKPNATTTPWYEILQSTAVWALILSTIQYDWSQMQIFNSIMKDYKSTISKFYPFIFSWVIALIAGILSDILTSYNLLDNTSTRQLMTVLAGIGPNLANKLVTCFGCRGQQNSEQIMECLAAAMGTYYAGTKLTPLDMSPNYAGTIMGISNGLGSFISVFNPLMLPHRFSNSKSFNELSSLLWLTCSMFLSGDIQSFNNPTNLVNRAVST